jgi:hypothetical protein
MKLTEEIFGRNLTEDEEAFVLRYAEAVIGAYDKELEEAFHKRLEDVVSVPALSSKAVYAVMKQTNCAEFETEMALIKTVADKQISVERAVEYIHAKNY